MWLIWLVFACGSPGSDPTLQPTAPDAAPASRAAPVVNAPLLAPTLKLEPGDGGVEPVWKQAPGVEGRVRTDGVAFWGFSEDERRFAWETFDPGPGLSRCEGTAELSVVDAVGGASVQDGAIVLLPADADADPCPNPGPAEAMQHVRLGHLALHGIRPGGAGTLLPVATESEGDRSVGLPDGRTARLKHEITGDSRGTGYRLVVDIGEVSTVIEDGSRTRAGVFETAPAGAFLSPSGAVLVVLLEARSREADRVHRGWLVDAAVLGALPGG